MILPLVALMATISLLPLASSIDPKELEEIEKLASSNHEQRRLNLYGRDVDMRTLFDYSDNHAVIFNENWKNLMRIINEYKNMEVPSEYRDLNTPVVDRDSSILDLKLRTGGLDYVENDYSINRNEMWTKIPGKDTPTAIAQKLLQTDSSLIVIMGEPGSGKTVALTKILNDLRSNPKVSWSLMVDLKKAIPASSSHNWDPSNIFSEALKAPKNIDLFKQLLAYNPHKINILLDNFHEVPVILKKKIFQYVTQLSDRGAGIVLSTTPNIANSIPIPNKFLINKNRNLAITQIEPLMSSSLDSFVDRYFQQKIGSTDNYNPKYAEMISKAIRKTNFYTSFENVKQFIDMVITGDKSVFVGDGLVGLQDYLKKETASPKEFGEILSTSEVNKMKLYEKFTSRAMPSEMAAEYFGLKAWNKIRRGLTLQGASILDPVSFGSRYIGNGEEFGYLVHDQTRSIFVHETYDYYFASRALINQIKANSPVHISQIIEFLSYPINHEQLKFIENNIAAHEPKTFENLFKTIAKHPKTYEIMNKLILAKSDTIAAGIFEHMKPNEIKTYVKLDEKLTSQSAATKHLSKFYSRQDMLFENGMVKSIKTINDILIAKEIDPKRIWNFEKFQGYTDNVVSERKPSLLKLKTILETLPQTFKTESFLNDYVHRLVVNGGFENRLLINELVHEGAVPPNINVKGESPLNIALKKRDLPLLKYLVEELKMPLVDKPTMTPLLVSALDSNPLPRYSMPDFWKMMQYAIVKSDGLRLPQLSNAYVGSIKPTFLDEQSPAYKLIIESPDHMSVDNAIAQVKENPNLINDLSPEIRNFRRKYTLSRGMKLLGSFRNSLGPRTLTEILLKYRGLDTLSPTEQAAYEESIRLALKRDVQSRHEINKESLSKKQLQYITENLADNIATKADYDFAKSLIEVDMVKAGVSSNDCTKMMNLVEDALMRTKIPSEQSLPSQKISLQDGVSLTRAKAYARMRAVPSTSIASGSVVSSPKPSGSGASCDFMFS